MFRSVGTCLLFILCFLTQAYNQSTCPPNLDFEAGDFTNWQCFTGRVDTLAGKNIMILNPSSPEPTRHEIISASSNPGLDPYGGFPKLCPYGGNYSVKLGNNAIDAQAEAISYTFTVPTTIDTFTFTYFYAVVFEDPQHAMKEQPRFFVTAYDVGTGELINCASFDYVSTASLPGFQQSPTNSGVLFKAWTPTSLQFAGLGGHEVRLEFRTGDCTLGGHFGYAYMDVASACSNILATAPYCIETNSLILDAPFGFKNYTWYNSDFSTIVGTGQSMTMIPAPVTTGVFYVDVEPYPGFGCRDTLQAFVKPMPLPDTPDVKPQYFCQYQYPAPIDASALPGHTLLWYTSETGGVGTSTTPRPPTNTAGPSSKYYVSQKALFGCEGFRREVVANIISTPIPSFTINNIRQCQNGNSFVFSSNSTNLDNATYKWEFGDGQTYSSTDTFSKYSYTTAGYFNVKLKAMNANTCPAEKTQLVVVVPKPVAAFAYPSPLCENQTLVTLTDQSYVPSGIASINQWWWNINGNIVQTKVAPSATAQPGPYPVKLVVTTTEGCRSDTNTAILNIRHRPLTAFGIGDLLCNNEVIRFTDQSTMPAADVNREMITKWHWTFDNSITTNTQNHYTHFSAGIHKAQLIAETSNGCKSIPLERSFEIFPKPIIDLDISDSCVYVPVTYTATDVLNNVVKFNWKFEDGHKEWTSRFTRYFNYEGNRSFTLYTLSDKGCKDTIYRPFTIFDNKSFAGKDTIAAMGEPVQLDARGEPNMQYTWTPSIGLNYSDIEKPVATLDRDQQYQLYTVTDKGCKKQSQIFIKRFAGPELYVPNAFTPNNDGHNDRLRVKPIGIKSFGYFAVYNRWGQMVFRTTNYNEGWDGTIGGKPVGTETFVYVAQAVDYKGKTMVRKGTVILLR
ncbi:T9SS type B sorting domain-containing protein [Niastella caeni]|uniref:T9SS type B sorting domain-containing protein n=1 Tax=Niastella caeni TaxID=2569763 RepID=A0A4S8HRS5_9BACT|nr:PKD domain-containing protein [Niastella caeni]THU38153.1 T9SS type B sorting domain-containing protein [Niastella caeni]